MILRLFTLFGFLSLSLTANALFYGDISTPPNCTKALRLTPSFTETGKFSSGSSTCINNEYVSKSFSPTLSAESSYQALNQLCNTPTRCSAQSVWLYPITGQYMSATSVGGLTTVKLQSTVSDPCSGTRTTINQVVLDSLLPENKIFLASYSPAGQWLQVSLQCTAQVVYSSTTSTNTYSKCIVKSAAPTTAPVPSKYCL